MKKKHLLFTLCVVMLAVIAYPAQAKVWRINNLSNYDGTTLYGENFGGTSLNPVFKQLLEAASNGAVLAGDTVHLEGSTNVYDGCVLTKKLVILGAGYYLTVNPAVSANLLPSEIGYIYFNTGSAGSQVIGASVTSIYGIQVNVSDITIRRCRITADIALYYNISDINIIGNYFEGSSTASAITVSIYGAAANVKVNNNIFQKTLIGVGGTMIIAFTECKNNVFDCPIVANAPSLRFNCAAFENNILKTPGASVNINNSPASDPKVAYNFSASASGQFGTANNNQVVVMTTLFVDQTPATPDGKYKLKGGTAAGSDGSERGVFGGSAVTNRYVLSGLPPVPVIYNIVTSGVAGPSGLPVTIKARTIQ